jgi:hypothetical protein
LLSAAGPLPFIAVISVAAASGADPGRLSRLIKKELERFSSLPLEFGVLRRPGRRRSGGFPLKNCRG